MPPSTAWSHWRRGGDPDFHGERFSNRTHRSATDPDARLYRKGSQQEAKLRYLAHNAIDLDSGVILTTGATQAAGWAERAAAKEMVTEVLPTLPYLPAHLGRKLFVLQAKARNTVREQISQQRLRQHCRARIRIEHIFAEAKECHGLDRARSRGLPKMHWQT